MAGPPCRGERDAQCSSRHLPLKDPAGRGNTVAAWAREPMSGRPDNNNQKYMFQLAPEERPFHWGIEVSPPHPPLEGEGERREGDAGDCSFVSNWYVYEDYAQSSIVFII